MTKVFISQPMKDKTNEEIEKERKEIIEKVENYFGKVEIIDSFFKGAPHDAKPLWFLGKSLELLSNADVIVFGRGWEDARGCIMEHLACENYKITIWEI